jgi:hypothetical protein
MMMLRAFFVFLFVCSAFPAFAQDEPLSFATVERLPFATQMDGVDTGFSLELMREISNQLGREITFEFSCDAVVTRGWVTRRRCRQYFDHRRS